MGNYIRCVLPTSLVGGTQSISTTTVISLRKALNIKALHECEAGWSQDTMAKIKRVLSSNFYSGIWQAMERKGARSYGIDPVCPSLSP